MTLKTTVRLLDKLNSKQQQAEDGKKAAG